MCLMNVIQYVLVFVFSAGYDVQSASSPNGVLYITGAPRYNHTGRVVIYHLDKNNKVVVSQILKGEQVSLFQCGIFAEKASFVNLKAVVLAN